MSSDDAVCTEVSDRILTIRLNRPDNRNSMTAELLAGVRDAVRGAQADAELRCVVVTGSGKTFCGGADFRSRQADSDRRPHEQLFDVYEHFLSLLDLEIPTIAAMNGHAIGGGLGLALVCDIRVANREARYGANFVRLGMHPGMATTYLLPRLTGLPNAAELLLTGRVICGAEAAGVGMVQHAVAPQEVVPKAMEIAREIATASPSAVRWTKKSLYSHNPTSPRAVAYAEALLQAESMKTPDFREGVKALLERREPRFGETLAGDKRS